MGAFWVCFLSFLGGGSGTCCQLFSWFYWLSWLSWFPGCSSFVLFLFFLAFIKHRLRFKLMLVRFKLRLKLGSNTQCSLSLFCHALSSENVDTRAKLNACTPCCFSAKWCTWQCFCTELCAVLYTEELRLPRNTAWNTDPPRSSFQLFSGLYLHFLWFGCSWCSCCSGCSSFVCFFFLF